MNTKKDYKLNIFVIHYEPLRDRKKYLENRLKVLGLEKNTQWIIQKRGEYSKEFKSYLPSEKNWNLMLKKVDGGKFRLLTESDFSVMKNYLKIYGIIKKRKIPVALILEDDVILSKDFLKRLDKCLETLPKIFDIAYTDSGINLRLPSNIEKLHFYPYSGFNIRTTASHFISLEGARKISQLIKPVMPIDLGLRYYEKQKKLKVFWLNGYLTYQGSYYGKKYTTSMQFPTKEARGFRKILLNVENKRFNKDFFSQVQVFLLDFLVIMPFRLLRIISKKFFS